MKTFIKWTIVFLLTIGIGLALTANAATQELIISQTTESSNCTVTDLNFNYAAQDFNYAEDFQLGTVKIWMRLRLATPALNEDLTIYITDPGRSVVYGSLPFDTSVLTTTLTAYDFDFTSQNIFLDSDFSYEVFIAPDDLLVDNALLVRYSVLSSSPGSMDCPFTGYTGPGDLKYEVYGYRHKFNPIWFIHAAYGSTTCQFVLQGNTTTASCSDPTVSTQNQTQDLFNGILLFLFATFGTLWGLEVINNKRKRFND